MAESEFRRVSTIRHIADASSSLWRSEESENLRVSGWERLSIIHDGSFDL